MVSIDLVSGQRQWELNIAGISTPWVVGDWAYVVADDGKLLCISAQRQDPLDRSASRIPAPEEKGSAHQLLGPVLARAAPDPGQFRGRAD